MRVSVILLVAGLGPARAQVAPPAPGPPAPLFASDDRLTLVIETDVRALTRDIGDDRGRHEALVRYGSGDSIVVEMRTRGDFRRQRTTCNFPPIRIYVATEGASATLFEGQDEIKLVTHCQNGRDTYEQYVLLEYLAYRVLNALTDVSLRARLAQITWVDTSEREETRTRLGILLESAEALASRMGGVLIDEPGIHPMDVVPGEMAVVDLYQYLIGNTDWSVISGHNMELALVGYAYRPIPYDFDSSGLVNARYARPDPRFPIRRVRDRLYRGMCHDPERWQRTIDHFNAQRSSIEALVQLEGLDDGRRQNTLEYIEEFYEVINSERRLRRFILDACRSVN